MQWSTDITYDSTENTLGADLLQKWSTDWVLSLKKKKKKEIFFEDHIWIKYGVEAPFMLFLEITVLVEYF